MKCVDLEDSADVVFDEVLCVEDLRSMCFARLFVPCLVAMFLPESA